MNTDWDASGQRCKPPRGVRRVRRCPRTLQQIECRRVIRLWLNARLVVIPEHEWAEKRPHARPRVRNRDLFANKDADPSCGKEEERGWMFTPPGCVIRMIFMICVICMIQVHSTRVHGGRPRDRVERLQRGHFRRDRHNDLHRQDRAPMEGIPALCSLFASKICTPIKGFA